MAYADAEVMAIALTALGEGLGIGVVGLGTEQPGLLPVPGDTLAPEVAEMRGERCGSCRVAHDAGLDDRAARAAG